MDRKVITRIAVVGVAILIVAGFALSSARASCNGCITTTDIRDNNITAADLGTSSVTTAKIATGAVGLTDLATVSKASSGLVAITGTTSSATPVELDNFTVAVPANGYLIIRLEGSYTIDNDAAAVAASMAEAKIGLCTVTALLDDPSCGHVATLRQQDADNTDATNVIGTFVVERRLYATAGSHTYFVNGQSTNAKPLDVGGCCGDAYATVLYTPASLTVTSP